MFIQNRAKSIAQRLNAKNIAPLRERIAEFADKIKFKKPLKSFCYFWLLPKVESLPLPLKPNLPNNADSANVRIKIDDVICVDLLDSADNSVLGMQFCTCGNFQASTDSSLVESSKISTNTKATPQFAEFASEARQPSLRLRFCESQNLWENQAKNAESNKNSPSLAEGARRWVNSTQVADSANNIFSDLESLLKDLKPWRKGPFNFCGIEVQSEWDSAIKFNIIAPHLSVEGKVVADIGCNNGYYAFRLLPLRPSKIVAFEPSAHCKMQFDLINAFVKSEICFEMIGVEDLADYDCKFDCILCLGVIYHRTNPLDCLKILKSALNPCGELIIDTLIIESEDEIVLSPLSYAKMKNVYFIPSVRAFQNWLKRAGFKEIELLEVRKTTSIEQRKTAWSGGESLEDFLDKNDKNKTIEGYNAPIRAYFKAKI